MRQTVIEIECSRCHRKEHVPAPSQPLTDPEPILIVILEGKEVAKFDDLCVPCQNAVKGYVESLTKPMEKKSPIRKKKTAAPTEAAPVPGPAQNGTGAKKEGAHPVPHPPVVRRAPSV